jgi:hypothetical protein
MNPQPHNKVPVFKLALIFTGILLLVNLIAGLISSSFRFDNILTWYYFKFLIGFEGLAVFLCAIFTTLITSKLMDFKFGTIVIRILVFSTIYLSLLVLVELIVGLYIGSMNYFDPNFALFNTGMRCSFLFLVVWMVLKYRNKVVKEDNSHI